MNENFEEQEIKIVCDVNKRRKCDSVYIQLYNKLLKNYNESLKRIEEYKILVNIYRDILDNYIKVSKGGEENGQTRNGFIK